MSSFFPAQSNRDILGVYATKGQNRFYLMNYLFDTQLKNRYVQSFTSEACFDSIRFLRVRSRTIAPCPTTV